MSEVRAEIALAPLRVRIDAIDAAMVDLLAERFRTVEQVIQIKRREDIPARLEGRVEAVVDHVRALAEARRFPPEFADRVWRSMIEWVIAFEEEQLSETSARHGGQSARS